MNNVVKKYFEDKSSSYKQDQETFPWNILRKLELYTIGMKLSKFEAKRYLELCCGVGGLTEKILQYNKSKIDAVDFNKEMLDKLPLSSRLTAICADVEDFTPERKYEVILSFGGFEYFKEPGMMVRKYLNYLKAGGSLIIISPTSNIRGKLYKFLHPIGDHVNLVKLSAFSEYQIKVSTVFPFNSMIVIKG